MLEIQRNNPLHGVKLEALLTELVEYYNWDVLADELNLNCFKQNPSIKSSLKFLRKTPWAREKVEGFYLYKYKRLPKPNDKEYELPPRDRTIPLNQKPGSPEVLGRKQFDEEEEKNKTAEDSGSVWGKSDSPEQESRKPVYKQDKTHQQDKKPKSHDDKNKKPYAEKSTQKQKSSNKPDPWANWRK